MRYLDLSEVLELYRRIMEQSGGAVGIRSLGTLESAIAQPRMMFDGENLYPTIAEKASALCFSIIQNHPLIDGNKRMGHAAMETFLVLNGCELEASVDEQEGLIVQIGSGKLERRDVADWIRSHIVEIRRS
jgi:death-on-curing protein